jgi:hypothetical protein
MGPFNYSFDRAGFKDCLVGSITSLFNDTVSNDDKIGRASCRERV